MTGRNNGKDGSEVETKIEEAEIEDSFDVFKTDEDTSFSRDLQGSMTMDAGERAMVDGATGTQNIGTNSV